MAHYLDSEIAALTAKCDSVTKEDGGAVLYRGAWGAARVSKKRVYFFEESSLQADEHFDLKSNREATLAALEWVIKGRV